MQAYASGDERIGMILRRQNPWWTQVAGARLLPRVPEHARPGLGDMVGRLGDRRVYAMIGARQIGKTTMLMQLVARLAAEAGDPKRVMYVSLDEPPLSSGPEWLRRILEWYVEAVVREPLNGISERIYIMLDEIQEVDGWQRFLKPWVDRGYNAKFIVSGSTSSGILSGSSGSLIGRMEYREVMPMSFPEYASLKGLGCAAQAGADMRGALAKALAGGDAGAFHAAARSAYDDLGGYSDAFRARLLEYMAYGGRPAVAVEDDAARKRGMLCDSLQLSIYEDVVRMGGVENPALIDGILSILAWRQPQTVNAGRLAEDLGAGRDATEHCLRLLRAAYLVQAAEFYSVDPGVRARADERVYIGDPGTRTAALRSLSDGVLSDPADRGRAAEAAVCDHTMRLALSYDRVYGRYAYYWRSGRGNKVDAVAMIGGKALPVVSAHAKRIRESDLRGIRRFAEKFGTRVGLVVSDEGMGLDDDGGIVTIPLWLYLLMC